MSVQWITKPEADELAGSLVELLGGDVDERRIAKALQRMPLVVVDVPEEEGDDDNLDDLEPFDVDDIDDDAEDKPVDFNIQEFLDVTDRLILVLGGDPDVVE